jgi:cysteinyl-tRNA synthetase
MIEIIQSLIKRGHAYEAEGHVLFHVPSFASYGKLSGRNRDEQIMGARVEVAPYKKDPADFVLWKPSTDAQVGWASPWGYGRPGWHIECSAMSKKHLGTDFDIHGGGLDLTFPHHENEIAQSVCAHDHSGYARIWMHNGFVMVEGEKMSKSIGNVLLVHDMLKHTSGEAIRLALISTHYRQPFDWTQRGLDDATKTLSKFYDVVAASGNAQGTPDPAFIEALCDDLNTPKAITELHNMAKSGRGADLKASAVLIGILQQDPASWHAALKSKTDVDVGAVEKLIAERNAARASKNWAESDRARDALTAMGVTIKDTPNGTQWSV